MTDKTLQPVCRIAKYGYSAPVRPGFRYASSRLGWLAALPKHTSL